MLTFQLEDGKQVQINREAVEERLLLTIFDKLGEAREKSQGMYNALKAAINMVMTFGGVDIKVPKGENTLEYLVAHYVSLGFDVLEQTPLSVNGKVVEMETNGETSRN
jgi:hypothetical protein